MESIYEKESPFISLSGVTLDYAQYRALSNIDIDLFRGEIHAIVGEHGAGKSTLAAIVSGFVRLQTGTITLRGDLLTSYNLKTAQIAGIRMVYQQAYLIEHFTVAENLFYTANSSTRMGFYNKNRIEEMADRYIRSFGFEIDPRSLIRSLSISDKTIVEILKNLSQNPTLLILDETLEKLSVKHFRKFEDILQKMRSEQKVIITITHRIDDVYRLADTVTVLKSGSRLITERVDNINKLNLIQMAYTQVGMEPTDTNLDTIFQQFLKYNEAILQHLPVSLVVVDEQSQIRLMNEHCVKTFKLFNTNYLSIPLENFLVGNREILKSVESSIHDRKTMTFYNIELLAGGVQSVNNIKTYPVFDGSEVIGTVLIIEDITEYDRMQKQLILSEKLASVGLLAAGVAHEINNPLEIITNYISHLKFQNPNKQFHDSINKVNREIEYISNIVSNLVTFSDNTQTSFEVTNIIEVINDMLDLLKYNADYMHISISFTHDTDELFFLGNKNQLKQVVLNIVKNSFEAMPSGGMIKLHAERVEEGGVEKAQITFQDNGPGISAQNLTTVFMPFFSSKPGGNNQLGLGLSISYRIVESFGGQMTAENIPEGGCFFVVSLPLA